MRGALPVGPLNAVLRELRAWTQPTLMLVGNHDQARAAALPSVIMPRSCTGSATSSVASLASLIS